MERSESHRKPEDSGAKLTDEFDRNDRKFVALSRTHTKHPPIIEATDGKWLGFKEVFEEYGVHIKFLDMDIQRSDKILRQDEVEEILCRRITIEEKIDGANLGIDQYILFGEWCYVKHSVSYNALPDWFVGFDIYDTAEKQFLSVERRNVLLDKMKVKSVPQLGQGRYELKELPHFLGNSMYGDETCEGIYIRQDQGTYLKYRAKMVRKEFRQSIAKHWSRKVLQCNSVKWQI